jgi:putative phage-type endonuclease
MMILQSDPNWATARLGCLTASHIADMMARTKSGWGASRGNYAAELVAERLTGVPASRFVSAEMQHGIDTEPLARAAYEFHTDATTGEAAFILHPTIEWSGASPDGFVGEDGLVEFKCPNTSTHIDTLLGGAIPEKYRLQCMWQMACTGRQWCDWVSFDPRLPESMRLFVRRLERDAAKVSEVEREAELFLAEIDDTIKRLRRTYLEAA